MSTRWPSIVLAVALMGGVVVAASLPVALTPSAATACAPYRPPEAGPARPDVPDAPVKPDCSDRSDR